MDAASLFGTANLHYVNEDYEEALKHYTCAVALQDCAQFRSCRAAAYIKLGQFQEALEESKAALALDAKGHMALHWRGIALFYLGSFAEAKASFEESQQSSPSSKAPRAMWIRKCDAELSGSALPLTGAAATHVVAKAPAAANTAASDAAPVVPAPMEDTKPSKDGMSISGRKQIKREWYQNRSHVFVTVFAKGVDREACKSEFRERELSLSFPLPGGSDEEYQLDLELFEAVVPEQCTCEVSKVKVELSLAKKAQGVQWRELEQCEAPCVKPDQPAYPTSNKQKRDWGQIDRDIDSELKNEKPAGDEALNKLFKEIYDRADDDTRRAMNKSFQTSGGTVLSTNWGEVARNDYEGKDRPTPPDGQEWRDWRKK